jgi:hypothetical protein
MFIRILDNEYKFWNITNVGLKETHALGSARITTYWTEGVGGGARLPSVAWSAAFISWVMRQAGRDLGLDESQLRSFFNYAPNHTAYLFWAKRGRIDQLPDRIYWLYPLIDDDGNSPTIQVGDLVAKNRDGGTITYSTLHGSGISHADIVFEVLADRLILIGGNVQQNVDKRIVFLDADGRIDTSVRYRFGQDPGGPTTVPPGHPYSQSQFFAVGKLQLMG